MHLCRIGKLAGPAKLEGKHGIHILSTSTVTMEQSSVVRRSWTLLPDSGDSLLARHSSHSWFSNSPSTSVSTFHQLGGKRVYRVTVLSLHIDPFASELTICYVSVS